MENLKASDRIAKWITEIRPLGVTIEPRTSIKGQILVNFIAEFTPGLPLQNNSFKGWILNVNGANSKGADVEVVLTTPTDPSSSAPTLWDFSNQQGTV